MHLTHPSKECPERRNVPRQQCSVCPAQRHPPWGTSLKQDYIHPGAEVPFSYCKGALPSHALKSYIAQNEYLILIFAPRVDLFLIHERQPWHCIIKKGKEKPGKLLNSASLGEFTEKAVAPHSSTLAWKIPWTEEPGGLQSMGSLRVRHD